MLNEMNNGMVEEMNTGMAQEMAQEAAHEVRKGFLNGTVAGPVIITLAVVGGASVVYGGIKIGKRAYEKGMDWWRSRKADEDVSVTKETIEVKAEVVTETKTEATGATVG